MSRRKPISPNLLLLGGGVAAAAVLLSGKKSPYKKGSPQQNAIDAGTAVYDANFFKNPPQDYALMPKVARALLVEKNGVSSFVNMKALPQMKLSEMDQQVSFWAKLAPNFVAESRLGIVKLGILTRTALAQGKFPPTALNVDTKSFVAYGDGPATADEIQKFWDAIDRVAIAVQARASWDPAAYANLTREMRIRFDEVLKGGAKAARGFFDAIFEGLGGSGILLTAAALGGGYLYFTRRR